MRSIKTVALVAATLLLVPQLAVAADLDTEVQDMKQRLEQMETQLKAQEDKLALLQGTGPDSALALTAILKQNELCSPEDAVLWGQVEGRVKAIRDAVVCVEIKEKKDKQRVLK